MATPRRLILRDLVIFQVKLLLDGLKDLLLVQLSVFAALADLLFGGSRRGSIFYGFMRSCERFDLWLNLYSAASRAQTTPGGLIEERPRGADSLLSTIEVLITAVLVRLGRLWRGSARARPSGGGKVTPPVGDAVSAAGDAGGAIGNAP
jgi:hypothetical protein